MAKKKFYVSYSVILTAERVIAAGSEKDALRIAEELKYDDEWRERLINSFDSDYEGHGAKYIKAEVDDVAPEDEPADNEEM